MRPGTDAWAAVIASAVLLNLAYPPFHLLIPSFVCLAPAVVALERCNRNPRAGRRQFFLGWWIGLATHGVALHWMALALWRHGRWEVLGYAVVLLWLATISGAGFAAVGWVRRRTGLPAVLAFPIYWTAAEWLLAHQGTLAMPWLGLGTSLTGYPVLMQIADLAGARGVTFLLAAANVALAMAWMQRKAPAQALRLTYAVALGVTCAFMYGVVRLRTLDQRVLGRVAVVQTAIDAADKWDKGQSDDVVGQVLELSHAVARERPQLMVWPESALPGALSYHPEWERAVGTLARFTGAWIVLGGLDGIPSPDGSLTTYNAGFLFHPTGMLAAPPYYKERLVPLFERGNGIEPGAPGPVYQTPVGRIGVVICGEASFEAVARGYRRRGAEALVNLSNDAWFAAGAGARQHLAHLVMRAIETRSGIARAANLGISGMVEPTGRIRHQLPAGEPGAAVGFLTTVPTVPLYVRLGDWVGWLSLAAGAVLLSVAALARGLASGDRRGAPHG
jgi:apolipoprotein N-acyltransferase